MTILDPNNTNQTVGLSEPLQPPTEIGGGYSPSTPAPYNPTSVNTESVSDFDPYKAAQASVQPASTYNDYSSTTVDPNAGQGAAITGNVGDDSLVENRMEGLLSRDSDYMQRAETTANQESNRRGLLNSSMAVGAAHGAAIDAALPIAQQDAATFGQMDQSNLSFENQMEMSNSQQEAVMAQFNAGEINKAERDNALADIQNQQFNAKQAQDTELANTTAQNQALQFNADKQLQVDTTNAEMASRANEVNANAENIAKLEQYKNINKENFEVLSASLQADLSKLDNALAEQLLRIEKDYNIQANLDSVNGAIYQQLVDGMAEILSSGLEGDIAKIQVEALYTMANVQYSFGNDEEVNEMPEYGGWKPPPSVTDIATTPTIYDNGYNSNSGPDF